MSGQGGIHEGADVLAYLAEQAGQPYPFETYTVRTVSDGWHLYFRAIDGRPIPNRAGKIVRCRPPGALDRSGQGPR